MSLRISEKSVNFNMPQLPLAEAIFGQHFGSIKNQIKNTEDNQDLINALSQLCQNISKCKFPLQIAEEILNKNINPSLLNIYGESSIVSLCNNIDSTKDGNSPEMRILNLFVQRLTTVELNEKTEEGNRPLDLLCAKGVNKNELAIHLLKSKGATQAQTLYMNLLSSTVAKNTLSVPKTLPQTSLLLACMEGDLDSVMQLVKDSKQDKKSEALVAVCEMARRPEHEAIAQMLLTNGADVHFFSPEFTTTPLSGLLRGMSESTHENRINILKVLVRYGVNPDSIDATSIKNPLALDALRLAKKNREKLTTSQSNENHSLESTNSLLLTCRYVVDDGYALYVCDAKGTNLIPLRQEGDNWILDNSNNNSNLDQVKIVLAKRSAQMLAPEMKMSDTYTIKPGQSLTIDFK